MIDESLIESARLIKNEFNTLNNSLSTYEDEIRNMALFFIKASNDLKSIGNNKKDSIDEIKEKVLSKLTEIEDESNKVSDKIAGINLKIEKLKKEEIDLYHVIKKRYPSLQDDEIKIEIQRRID